MKRGRCTTLELWVSADDWRDADRGQSCAWVGFVRGPALGLFDDMGWGVKCYPWLRTAVNLAAMQRELHRLGLAPAVGPFVRVVVEGLQKPRYGYISQRATRLAEDDKDGKERIRAVAARLRKEGYTWSDDHGHNVGWVHPLGWVVIDVEHVGRKR